MDNLVREIIEKLPFVLKLTLVELLTDQIVDGWRVSRGKKGLHIDLCDPLDPDMTGEFCSLQYKRRSPSEIRIRNNRAKHWRESFNEYPSLNHSMFEVLREDKNRGPLEQPHPCTVNIPDTISDNATKTGQPECSTPLIKNREPVRSPVTDREVSVSPRELSLLKNMCTNTDVKKQISRATLTDQPKFMNRGCQGVVHQSQKTHHRHTNTEVHETKSVTTSTENHEFISTGVQSPSPVMSTKSTLTERLSPTENMVTKDGLPDDDNKESSASRWSGDIRSGNSPRNYSANRACLGTAFGPRPGFREQYGIGRYSDSESKSSSLESNTSDGSNKRFLGGSMGTSAYRDNYGGSYGGRGKLYRYGLEKPPIVWLQIV